MIKQHHHFLFTLFLLLIVNCSVRCCVAQEADFKKREQEALKLTLTNGINWKWFLWHRINRQREQTSFLADVSLRHAALHAKLTSIRPSSPNKKGDTLT